MKPAAINKFNQNPKLVTVLLNILAIGNIQITINNSAVPMSIILSYLILVKVLSFLCYPILISRLDQPKLIRLTR